MRIGILFAVVVVLCRMTAAQSAADAIKTGHSFHGSAFDSGPRQKPWTMTGIGDAPFPITAKNPEVQKWFNQGNALLHSFWFYEAERSFRWCLKLEPDNAMVYWGLARATEGDRAKDFAREAAKRKDSVSERERMFIEAEEAELLPDPVHDKDDDESWRERHRNVVKKYESICVKYPDDMEARAYLALATMGEDRYGTELVIREVLAKQPRHPAAHHYRIHNWDYHEPEQALPSARVYGDIVPSIGHALHMPGHIFSIVGMWNEAAISMDAATRAEKRYMNESLTFPFNQWNYGHNRNYLSYIQEQLGMAQAAIFGARQLIDAPLDPADNNTAWQSPQSYGIFSLARALLRFERWDELVDGKTVPWRDDVFRDKVNKAYCETRAWLGKGDRQKAEKSFAAHADLKKDLEKNKDYERFYNVQQQELKGRLALARKESIVGLGMLAEAADHEFELQRQYADPPLYFESLYNSLGEEYLKAKSPALAVQAFEKALELTHNDLFALSGLVRAHVAEGDREKAQDAMARLLFVTGNADAGLQVLERAKATGVTAEPRDSSPGPQRNYAKLPLDQYGPPRWEPYPAPQLDVRDSTGKRVTLEDYRGKNVMLVFYLGYECPHCLRQLHSIGEKKADWEKRDTVLLAVSSADPAKNAAGLKEYGELPVRVLSDQDHVNARRFHSYDDFEDMELHATILIDKKGRMYWTRFGGEPFGDLEFLTKQLDRMNELVKAETVGSKAD
jgi:peroxiredoxin/tetratricopeptide (TPR) repeat protein